MTFAEWRIYEGYKSREELLNDISCAGYSIEEINAAWDEVEEGYEEYCDEEGIDCEWD